MTRCEDAARLLYVCVCVCVCVCLEWESAGPHEARVARCVCAGALDLRTRGQPLLVPLSPGSLLSGLCVSALGCPVRFERV